MKLSQIIGLETVKVPLTAKDKYAAIEELVDLLHQAGKISEKTHFLRAVLDREATRSTGIGMGLAIPHGKSEHVGDLICAVGKVQSPMEFESIDGQPVHLIVLVGSSLDQTGPHIQALARISRLMMAPTVRDRVARALTAKHLHQIFLEHEQ